jgi:hypothetical protein
MSQSLRRHRWLVLVLIAVAALCAGAFSGGPRIAAQNTGRPAGTNYTGKAFTFK